MDNEHRHNRKPGVSRLPEWMRFRIQDNEETLRLKKLLKTLHLHTVCQSAGCPNISECFRKPTATFMILGSVCTRSCRFCGVSKGKPEPVDPEEPEHIARAVRQLGLKHVVITSVTRDDLPDGGAGHFADTVTAVRQSSPEATLETLIPDFLGSVSHLEKVLHSGVHILNHNVETVPSLYARIRPEADFRRSLNVLKQAKRLKPDLTTKSGIMAGLGETEEELRSLFENLAEAGCDALTIGQYLQPSARHEPVFAYVEPERFDRYADLAREAGIPWVYAGPHIRSSYNAEELMRLIREKHVG